MYFSDVDDRQFALKPMNCPGACSSSAPSAAPIATCRCDSPSTATSRATSARASFTVSCAFAPSPRTTLTSTAPSTRSRPRSTRSASRSTSSIPASASKTSASSSPPPREVDRLRRGLGGGREGADRGARGPGPRVHPEPGRRLVLRPEDRLPRDRRARPLLAARHLPARLPDAGALRAHLLGRGQLRAPPGDDPPRPHRLDGALRRDPDRALRGPLPRLARSGTGRRAAGRGSSQRAGRRDRGRTG